MSIDLKEKKRRKFLHLLTYYLEECCLEVYVGKLNKIIDVKGTENKLFWSTLDKKFFDETKCNMNESKCNGV